MPAEREGVRTLTRNTTTALSAVDELEAALVEARRHGSGSLDRLVASAEAVIAATREPVPHAPYALRRMTLPERWKGHLIDGIDGDLTTDDLAACDALRTSIAEYGWKFTEAGPPGDARGPDRAGGNAQEDRVPGLHGAAGRAPAAARRGAGDAAGPPERAAGKPRAGRGEQRGRRVRDGRRSAPRIRPVTATGGMPANQRTARPAGLETGTQAEQQLGERHLE